MYIWEQYLCQISICVFKRSTTDVEVFINVLLCVLDKLLQEIVFVWAKNFHNAQY